MQGEENSLLSVVLGKSSRRGPGRGVGAPPCPIRVPMSPSRRVPSRDRSLGGVSGKALCPCDVRMSPVTAHRPAVPWQTGSLCSLPAAGPARPLPAQGMCRDGAPQEKEKGLLLLQPPLSPLAPAQSPPGPLSAQGWHLRPSPPCSGGTKGHTGQLIQFLPPTISVTCRVCSSTRRGL